MKDMKLLLKYSVITTTVIVGILTLTSLTEGLVSRVFNPKPKLTLEKQEEIRHYMNLKLDYIKGQEDNPAGIFIYGEDYETRKAFVTIQTNAITPVFIPNDVVYSEMLEYHQKDLCYLAVIDYIDESALKNIARKYGYDDTNSKYMSCPIYVRDRLVGYISLFYKETDVRGLTPLIQNRMRYLAALYKDTLEEYL